MRRPELRRRHEIHQRQAGDRRAAQLAVLRQSRRDLAPEEPGAAQN